MRAVWLGAGRVFCDDESFPSDDPHAVMDYLDSIGCDRIAQHDQELGTYAFEKLATLKGIRLFGPTVGRAGLVSFLLYGVHAHDVVAVWRSAAAIIAISRS
jgi:selenocysteine lyase/cysteine desulfurase